MSSPISTTVIDECDDAQREREGDIYVSITI